MNRIYKVIFNKAKGLYEVVSELAHNHSKTKLIATDKRKLKLFLTHLSLIASVLTIPISAAAYDGIYDSITEFLSAHPEANTNSFGIANFNSKNTSFGYVLKDYNGLTAGHKYLFVNDDTGTGGAEGGAGKIYHYAIDVTNNSDLSDEQKQTVKDLIKNVDGDQTVNGNQTTTGNSETKGNSTTDGSSTVKGDQTVGGTTNTTNLNVSGDTNLHNTTITGDSHVTNNQTVGGNENVGGTTTTKELHVTDSSTIDKNQTVKGDQTVAGTTTTKELHVTDSATVDKNLTVSGNSETKGNNTIDGNQTVSGDSSTTGNQTVGGNSTVSGDQNVSGNTTIGKDLTVDGTSTLTGDVTTGANVTVGKDLAVKGNSAFTGNVTMNSNASIGKDLTVEGTSTLKGDVFAKSNVTIDKDLTVKGTTNFLGDINIDKDLTIGGSQTVKGDSTINGSQQIGKDLHVAGTSQLDGNVLMGSNAIVQQNLGVGGNADIKGDLYVHDHNYIDSQGINANGYQIRNVADGAVAPGSHDAVNGGQLYSTKQALTGQINKVGAGAAALAGLHPGEFDPDNKLDFAAGYGHYKDANAAALGVFYHPNEDTTINLSGTMGNGDPMLSAGVTFKLGPSGTKTMSRTALTKQIKEDQKVIKAMADEMAAMKAQMSRVLNLLDMSKKASFSDVPADHWAKDAVDTLHGNGALKGYPDGQFHGDKPMTRYEYAQMLYEALQKGAHVDQSTLDEYAPELSQVKANNQK